MLIKNENPSIGGTGGYSVKVLFSTTIITGRPLDYKNVHPPFTKRQIHPFIPKEKRISPSPVDGKCVIFPLKMCNCIMGLKIIVVSLIIDFS